jgi:lipopolysaccharide/colanic/teichoic acid biosynthesis glycosyltransferase
MKSNNSTVYSIFLALGDFMALIAAFITAYILRVTISSAPIANPVTAFTYFKVFLILLPFWVLIFALLGLYSSNIYERRFRELGRLLLGSFIGLLFVIFYNFLLVRSIFPAKLVPIYGFGLGFIFLVLFRNLARAIRTLMFGFDVGITNILIIGNTAISDELLESLKDSRRSGYRVLAVVGDSRRQHHSDFADFAESLEAIRKTQHSLDGIIQTELYTSEEHNREILDFAQENHVSYRFIPGNTELFVGNIDVELFRNSIPVIAVRQTPLFGWGRVVKRLFDIAMSAILLVIASPFMLLIALGVKITDPAGPVFMRGKQQNRLTRFNEVFKVLKFRTHYAKYDGKTDEEVFAMVGKPELIHEYRRNGDKLVKSGLTGLAVVSGRSDIPYEERRKLDMYYVQNWNFWFDITILIKTIRVVVERTGAR